MNLRRIARTLVVPTLALSACAGCGSHLYRAQNHQLALDARTAFDEAKFDEVVTDEYALNAEMTASTIAVIERLIAARRDRILTHALKDWSAASPDGSDADDSSKARETWQFLQDQIDDRLKLLAGDSPVLARIIGAPEELRDDRARADQLRTLYRITRLGLGSGPVLPVDFARCELDGIVAESCEELQKVKQKIGSAPTRLKVQGEAFVRAWSELLAGSAALGAQSGPLLLREHRAVVRTRSGLATLSHEADLARERVKEAERQYLEATHPESELAQAAVAMLVETEALIGIDSQLRDEPSEMLEEQWDAGIEELQSLRDAAIDDVRTLGSNLVRMLQALRSSEEPDTDNLRETIAAGYEKARERGSLVATARVIALEIAALRNKGRKLSKKLGAVGIGVEAELVAIEMRLDHVNDLVALYVGGGAEPPRTDSRRDRLLTAVVLSARRVNDLRDQLNKVPPASGLLLEARYLRLLAEAARLKLERQRRELELRQDKVDALFEEARELAQASKSMTRAREMVVGEEPNWERHSSSLIEDWSDRSAINEDVTRLLYHYSNSWTLGRLGQERAEYELIGLDHDRALDLTATALLQWENLIGVPLASLVGFHGAGLKAEDVIGLLDAAGLAAIATGVN